MKFLVVLLAVASVAHGKVLSIPDGHTAYGYLEKSIALGESIRAREEKFLEGQRIVGGVPAALGQIPFQAALLIDIIGHQGRGVCGGSLITPNRVASAAHCWFDGLNQAWRVEVVLGSITLFSGGNRQHSSVFINHPNWFPLLVRNDVAVIYLPSSVTFNNNIAPVSLPQGAELQEDFSGESAIASGFGLTADDANIPSTQFLSQVRINVISNSICRFSFPLILQDSNICTSGIGGVGPCRGDSGGPLVITRGNRQVLIGITSFGSAQGCQVNSPAAFARVTSFLNFFNSHI